VPGEDGNGRDAGGAAGAGSPATRPGGSGPAPVAAFFDLDNTIVRGASAFHLAVALRRRGLVRFRDLVEFALLQARYLTFGESVREMAHARDRALHLVAGRSVAEVAAVGEEVWDEVLSLRIFPGTHALLTAHLEAGHQVWVVTASPVEVGRLIAAHLGATGALGTVAEHVDGYYTGRLMGDMLHGSAKAVAVRELAEREGLDLSRCFAYGDSAHDVPILSAVGFPTAINPDGRLRRHAREAGWPVRNVRGRADMTARRTVRTASWAGVVWVAGLVVRAVRRAVLRRG
jgi:HAD superfamily hydrolase (TIGR01490 family)